MGNIQENPVPIYNFKKYFANWFESKLHGLIVIIF